MHFIRIIKANQKVYHGSPYKFDSFDESKIGAGDGNKYGWGIYFTSNPEFANSYGSGKETYDGKPLSVYESLSIPDLLANNRNKVIEEYKDFKPEVAEFAKNFDPNKYNKAKGYVYVCSIPNTNELLNYEGPITNKNVQKLIKDYNIKPLQKELYGVDVYIQLAHKLGSKKAASLELQKYGVPGLYYEDDGICFVIWDTSKIKILEVK